MSGWVQWQAERAEDEQHYHEELERDAGNAIPCLIDRVHHNAVNKGFWEGQRNDAEQIALMHSELSECLEAMRDDPNAPSEKIPAFSKVEEELADAVIRIMDYCGGRDLDLLGAILAKMEYNEGRPHKHGKRF